METFTYDANGNELTWVDKLQENGQWVNSDSFTFTYDARGDELTYLLELSESGQWTDFSCDTSTYDANGHLLTHLYGVWQNGQWTDQESDTYTYDAKGNKSTVLLESWEGHWVDSLNYSYTYGSNENELTWLIQQWQNGQWANYERDTLAYDANGNLTLYLHERWSGSSWTPSVGSGLFDHPYVDVNGNFFDYEGYEVTFTYALITAVQPGKSNLPGSFSLEQNYPNPFNPTTTIKYQLAMNSNVTLKVYDVLGREVETLVNERQSAGSHNLTFNASNLPSGVYLYRLQAGTFTQVKKMILMK
ncbi:MAG TPA: T9SS type A sorting domain-containing protein [Candidatus Kryptonia bacterium]